MSKIILLLLIGMNTVAQAEPWQHDVTADLTGSQVRVKDWAQGGEDAFSWEFDITGKSVLETQKYNWTWKYGFDYGQTQQGDRDPRKTDDRVTVSTTYLRNTSSWVKPYVAAGLRTQVTAGHRFDPKVKISDFWDPAYLTEAAGIGRGFAIGAGKVSTRAGASFRHVVRDETTTDFGLESVTDLDYNINEISTLTSQVKFFRATGRPWVILSDTALRVQLTERIVLRAEFTALKDDRTAEDWQLKQSTEIGIGWSL